MWGPLKKKKDPQFPGNGGPNDPRLPYLVGTLNAYANIQTYGTLVPLWSTNDSIQVCYQKFERDDPQTY